MKYDIDMQWQNVTYDICLSKKWTVLYQVVLTDNGSGNADVTIYDGHSTSGKVVFIIRALQHTVGKVTFLKGLKLHQGLFVDIGTNVGSCLIRFKQG